MGFLAPTMLWGAAAAAIPIALHLFFRSRYRTVPWAAMKFLLTSIEQTSRRLRFQELLLLVLRCAVLILLALALARPLSRTTRGAGAGDAVDAVFVFDTSLSMGARDGASDRLSRAKDAALKTIDDLPPYSTVQVIACADRAALLGPREPGDLEQARIIVKYLPLTSLATDLAPGATEAAGILERGQASNKELYIFSDMQKLGFEQEAGSLAKTLQAAKEKATVHFVRCGTRPVANAAIVGITPPSGLPRPGDRVGVGVLVRNSGTEPVKDLTVSLAVDGDDKHAETQALARLDPGQTRAVPLTAKLDNAGLRVLTAKLDHDDLGGDNRFDQVIVVREQVHVLVVDGGVADRDPRKMSSFELLTALTPVKDTELAKFYLQPRRVTPRLASPALLAQSDVCVLVNVALEPKAGKTVETPPADFLEALTRFVKEGKSLVIYAGDHVVPDAYNRILGSKHGLLPLPIKGIMEQQPQTPLKLNPASAGLPAFLVFRDDGYYKGFEGIEIYKALALDEPNRALEKQQRAVAELTDETKKQEPLSVVLRYSNGAPAVVSRLVGAGEVFLITTSADQGWQPGSPDPTWTNWPIAPQAVPFVHVMISHLLQGQTQNYNVVAGNTLDWQPALKGDLIYTLEYPDGKMTRLGLPALKGGRPVVTASDLPLAGIHYMVATRGERTGLAQQAPDEPAAKVPFAVVPDLRETQDLSQLSDDEIDQRLGFRPVHLTAGAAAFSTDARLGREWTTWLLAAVLLLALAETALAYWCGRAW